MKNVNEGPNKAAKRAQTQDISERITKFRGDIEDAAHEAGRTIKTIYDEKRSEVNEWLDDYSATVRRRPIQTSLIVLACGYLLGKLTR